jgi:NAD(P)-dependent dehydrogenase (short-subunit alcohol dehydrogenase family)
MRGGGLEGLQVLVTGIDALISRGVVQALVAEKALVTAVDGDPRILERFQRDIALYRTESNIAAIDLFSGSEMRLFAENLQSLGRLPHLVVCCCDGGGCPAVLAAAALRPSLVLHALAASGGGLLRAFAALGVPNLPNLLEPGRRKGVFDTHGGPRRVAPSGSASKPSPAARAISHAAGRLLVPGIRRKDPTSPHRRAAAGAPPLNNDRSPASPTRQPTATGRSS